MSSVLIIEDDEILLEMYKDVFVKNEFDVTTAVDGEEGLRIALEDKPDLVLLDLALPKKNGISVLESLRDDAWGTNVPIIVLTNLNVDGALLDKIIKNRPAYCLMKVGVTPDEVIAKAKEILL
jgi:two-component system, OmpR family, alkaline phosphatase synthesis response regulator PhoP